MNLAIVQSRALLGLSAPAVTAEVHLSNGLPSFTLVGLAEIEVKEARERVRSALLNSGFLFPSNKRITVNLAPADLPKDSGRFDLPIALGILAASGQIDGEKLGDYEFVGELSLAGELRPVRGALAMSYAMRVQPQRAFVLPLTSAREAAWVSGVRVLAAEHLLDAVAPFLPSGGEGTHGLKTIEHAAPESSSHAADFSEVRGQFAAKRALEVAASGLHSLLMIGPPGSGKSMLAQRLPGILPPLAEEEALQSAAILSVNGAFHENAWGRRPFRTPHHSASAVALAGGGSPPKPGEISLAHHGVLFLDEMPEFPRAALEALREPLESGQITISRAARQAQFPARFLLAAAMNPCPCGWLGDASGRCRCTPEAVLRYQGKLSGPLLDRIDIQIEVPAVPHEELMQGASAAESSATIAERVRAARERQSARQGMSNAQLGSAEISAHCALSEEGSRFLRNAAQRLGWSARGLHRVLRVARSIADLAAQDNIAVPHLAEAIQYRRGLLRAQ